jgi:GTP-binding protein
MIGYFFIPLRAENETNHNMASSNFVDYVKIFCRSGHGGAGSAHFRREKFVAMGGPDGGDGGKGGSVILRGNSQYWTLIHLKYQRHIFAQDGESGSGARSSGKSGADSIIQVPLGTVARDADTGEIVGEVTADGEELVLLQGGRGGLGNWHFKSSTNQAPRYSQPGDPRLEATFILELKLLADVGLVGFPNAGKSTLLAAVSAAKPKIADYAFTTLEPNLGIVEVRDGRSFVMADIPGIIEGAHEGKGLGTRFLRHIERNSILLFMIPATSEDIREEYRILLNELTQYNPELLDKGRLLAITKCDTVEDGELKKLEKKLPPDIKSIFISSVSGYNITALKDLVWGQLTIDN